MTMIDINCWERGCACYDSRIADETVEVVLAKQGEPVAWYVDFGNEHEPNYFVFGAKPDDEPTATVRPLVFADTTPQQSTWVGLTNEEILEFDTWHDNREEEVGWCNPSEIVAYIDAKLKQKNGYAEEKNT